MAGTSPAMTMRAHRVPRMLRSAISAFMRVFAARSRLAGAMVWVPECALDHIGLTSL
jgi:hypothetical protein